MNPIIITQLTKCKIAAIPKYDENTTTLIITKNTVSNNQECIPGHYYIIKLASYLTNPPNDYPLHINWNKGIIPKDDYYKCEVVQLMGKMLKINGVGYNYETKDDKNTSWTGWLPLDGVEILEEI